VRRRAARSAVLGAALVLAAATAVVLASPAAAGDCYRPEEPPDEGWEPYQGSDPTRVRMPYTPWRILDTPCPFPPEFRAVVVEPGRVVLLEAGQFVREAPLPEGPEVRFEDVARAVGDPAWIAEVEAGVFLVDTPVVQRGATMVASAPAVRELRLTTRPHVFLGGTGATARFEGVTVTSWDPAVGGPDTELADGRPFVVYRDRSRLDVIRSRFQHLGSDRAQAYGVSWRGWSTGSAIESTFANNYFGAYTFEGEAITFRGNTFRDNIRYGLDPHDRTHGLVIEGNEAVGNGTHGIVLSSLVNRSVIRGNHAHHNGANGIVLHKGSDHNVVEGNRVEHNRQDGIVVLGSGDVRVAGNTVRGHEVGIRVNGPGSERIIVKANVLEDNTVDLQAYGGANRVLAESNVHRGTRDVAVSVDVPQADVRNERVVGGRVGVEVIGGRARVQSVHLTAVDQGVVVRSTARAEMAGMRVRAHRVGVRALPGSAVALRGGTIDAPRPYSWQPIQRSSRREFGYIGLAALASAVGLHALSRARNRDQAGGPAPAHVTNTT
jgi:parallel beta-helix repeat protein